MPLLSMVIVPTSPTSYPFDVIQLLVVWIFIVSVTVVEGNAASSFFTLSFAVTVAVQARVESDSPITHSLVVSKASLGVLIGDEVVDDDLLLALLLDNASDLVV